MNSEELITRYIYEVGNLLPQRGREDIQQELESLIRDEIEERAGYKEASASLTADVLKEFGRPEKIAAQYRGEEHLIGPELFPIYKQVMTIVLSVLTGFYILILALSYWDSELNSIWANFQGWAWDYVGALITWFGIMTLAFAGIERYFGRDFASQSESAEEEWDPFTLPAIDDPDRIKRFEVISGIIGAIVFGGIFLSVIMPDGVFGWMVSPEIRPIVPLIVISFAAQIAVKGLLLWQDRWTVWLRWVEIGVQTFGAYVTYLLFSAPEITTLGAIDNVFYLMFGISLIVYCIDIVVKIVKVLWRMRYGTSWSWKNDPIFSTQK
ncbi:MAG: hypothetical protein AAF633_26500 [Chloroflexota bacterium]